MPPLQPKELLKVGDASFKIVWVDRHESVLPAAHLRRNCPCAACSDEWTGRRTLDPKTVPDGLKLEDARLVGNYAIQFDFADGHRTGIFTFETLRRLCPCADCASGPS